MQCARHKEKCKWLEVVGLVSDVSRSEVLGQFYNPNTTPKDKERVVVCCAELDRGCTEGGTTPRGLMQQKGRGSSGLQR